MVTIIKLLTMLSLYIVRVPAIVREIGGWIMQDSFSTIVVGDFTMGQWGMNGYNNTLTNSFPHCDDMPPKLIHIVPFWGTTSA